MTIAEKLGRYTYTVGYSHSLKLKKSIMVLTNHKNLIQ